MKRKSQDERNAWFAAAAGWIVTTVVMFALADAEGRMGEPATWWVLGFDVVYTVALVIKVIEP